MINQNSGKTMVNVWEGNTVLCRSS